MWIDNILKIRTGAMLIGKSMSGKSKALQILI